MLLAQGVVYFIVDRNHPRQNEKGAIMTLEIFKSVIITGLAALGLAYLVVGVCAGFDPVRGLAGCALLVTARYMS